MRTENDRSQFSIAIVTQEEKDVWCTGCSSLFLSRLCWGSGCRATPASLQPPPDTQGEQTGHVVQGAPINLYAKKKKIYINLCKAWARHSASSEHLSCCAPELGTEQRHREGPLWPQGHDAYKAHLHCCLSPVILYTP